MRPAHLRRQRHGFTLIEILVVLVIIGILAGVLLPVVSSARNAGYRATCTSNLRQLSMAMNLYVQDNKFYPRVGEAPEHRNFSGWVHRLLPYAKSPGVFECPVAEDGECHPDRPSPAGVPSPVNNPYDGSYDMNSPYAIFDLVTGYGGLGTLVHPSFYRRPSSTILLLDGDGNFVNPGYQPPPFEGIAGLKRYGVDAPHEGGANCAFVDGHVKWFSLEALTKRSLWTASGPE